eukprot:scaffold18338_cov122-Isochrysis_galbana.AAC.4
MTHIIATDRLACDVHGDERHICHTKGALLPWNLECIGRHFKHPLLNPKGDRLPTNFAPPPPPPHSRFPKGEGRMSPLELPPT